MIGETQIESENTACEQHVLNELRMRTEDRESDHDRKNPPGRCTTVANAANEKPQHRRQQRTHEQFSVMPWRHKRRDLAAQHVRKAADQTAAESKSPRAQKSVREDSGEEE